MNRRTGAKWTVNECLRLTREYDLLGLSIQEIAVKHERSVEAILYKLQSENNISDWVEARGYTEYHSHLYNDANNDDANDDAASENSDSDSDSEYNNNNKEEEEEEYDSYNIRQQINELTKQISYLTKFVHDAFSSNNSSSNNRFRGQSLAGFH